MNRYTEEMKLWLFDLAHGNLEKREIVAGFIRHYVLHDCTMQDVRQDILFRTCYGECALVTALGSLNAALEDMVSGRSQEQRAGGESHEAE